MVFKVNTANCKYSVFLSVSTCPDKIYLSVFKIYH